MFLHIGNDVEIMKKNIVAIISIESISDSKISIEFLKNLKKQGKTHSISDDTPKSIVIVNSKKNTEIYLSPISSITLQKRTYFVQNLM